ncbi:toll/interleukin-1 receptor domain-containing protein [Candidatus Poribacteria bacterium]|nr:toll/interleukin-1 receptor domain-containing protein [Candidatus Poribacteria bacterium]
MSKPTVFISYSHKDEDWKDRLVTQLGVLKEEGILDLWDDRRIEAGEDWYQKIQEAMNAASVAILMVSANFLTSKFILNEEVPRLLERREKEGMRVFPVIVKPCAWKRVKWLARMQLRPKDGNPLSAGDEHQIDVDLAAIAEEVAAIIDQSYVEMAKQLITSYANQWGIGILGIEKACESFYGTNSYCAHVNDGKGIIYCHADGKYKDMVFCVRRGIGYYYKKIIGGAASPLGLPITDEQISESTKKPTSFFEGGYIEWDPRTSVARAVVTRSRSYILGEKKL